MLLNCISYIGSSFHLSALHLPNNDFLSLLCMYIYFLCNLNSILVGLKSQWDNQRNLEGHHKQYDFSLEVFNAKFKAWAICKTDFCDVLQWNLHVSFTCSVNIGTFIKLLFMFFHCGSWLPGVHWAMTFSWNIWLFPSSSLECGWFFFISVMYYTLWLLRIKSQKGVANARKEGEAGGDS